MESQVIIAKRCTLIRLAHQTNASMAPLVIKPHIPSMVAHVWEDSTALIARIH